MTHTKRMMMLVVALLFTAYGEAQMRITFEDVTPIKEETLSDGSTYVQLPSGTNLNDFAQMGMDVTVGGRSVPLADITPNPATTFITANEIETFVYDGKAYSFRFSNNEYSHYLFAYFNGNNQWQEQICFALSDDGFNYTPLNGGAPVISSADIALKQAVRDPHILRGEDGYFYMVVTDMCSSQGWASNDGLVLLRSGDLINWTHTAIDFPTLWPWRFDRNSLTQVWAPQTIYDPEEGKYMVYYTIGESGKNHIIYYSYANEDFTELDEPQVLYDHNGQNTIDADIVWHNGEYHMFFKTEGQGNGIQKATATTLKGPWTPEHKDLQQTKDDVEGSCVFQLIGSDTWVLMYDCYNSGRYEYCTSTDLRAFTYHSQSVNTSIFTPRHGTTITITIEEKQRLLKAFGH